MALPPVAPRYMSRFQCIADRCEDTCCNGIPVVVSPPEWERFKQEVQKDGTVLTETPANNGQGFLIPKKDDGHCVFLDPRKLCSVHAKHGHLALSSACVLYPRYTVKWGEQLKMTGTIACPEVARLSLLAEDAMDVVPIAEELVYRPDSALKMPTDNPEEGASFHANKVSTTAQQLLRRKELPISLRLYLLGQLADRLHPVYSRKTEAFRGEGRATAEAQLTAALQAADSLEGLEAARRDLETQPLQGEFFAEMYLSLLMGRAASTSVERYHTLVNSVLEAYGGVSASMDQAWSLYAQRREQLEQAHGARLNQYFSHHALNHILTDWFAFTPSVLVDVIRLVVLGGVLRWVLLGHPDVVRLCEEPPSSADEARERMDRAAVECFQIITRNMELWPDLLSLARGLAGQGGPAAMKQILMLVRGYADPVRTAS